MRSPKPTLAELQLKRQNDGLGTEIVKLRRELSTKQQYARRLEFLLHERLERIDELNGTIERLARRTRGWMPRQSAWRRWCAGPPLLSGTSTRPAGLHRRHD